MLPKLPGNPYSWRVVPVGKRTRGQLWKQARAGSEKVSGATLKDRSFVLKAVGEPWNF